LFVCLFFKLKAIKVKMVMHTAVLPTEESDGDFGEIATLGRECWIDKVAEDWENMTQT